MNGAKRKEESTLTTGEASRLIGVCIKTIEKLVDKKQVKSFVIPGGSHRRIIKDAFYKYCEEQGIPILNQE